MKKIIFLFLLYSSILVSAQEDKAAYKKSIKTAEEQYHSKLYKESAQSYFIAFSHLKGKAYSNDRYNAACSYSLSNQLDSAFKQLFVLTDISNYSNLNHIMVDGDLNNLKNDERWTQFVEKVTTNKTELEKNYNIKLVNQLDKVYQSDQGIRMGLRDSITKYGNKSKEVSAIWKNMRIIDSTNESIVSKILDEHGWLGKDKIGKSGNSTLFLVIQHASLETQLNYIPMMREAVKNGNASGSSLALMEDRVALRQGKRQIYGSQIGSNNETGKSVVQPLIDPTNVDERRKSVGLSPISEYTIRFGFEWNLEQYLKDLPELEEQYGIK
jgi:hypothetical protein